MAPSTPQRLVMVMGIGLGLGPMPAVLVLLVGPALTLAIRKEKSIILEMCTNDCAGWGWSAVSSGGGGGACGEVAAQGGAGAAVRERAWRSARRSAAARLCG
eukprot:scaffold113530_cov75-Phaeocystis_antarctica.AAC.1